jgi:cytochrome c-type biogenesis protein CcmH/NrfG
MRRDAGEIDGALADLVAFLKAEPWQLDVLASLAETLAAGHRTNDARFAAERVLRFDPDHPAALFVLGALQAAAFDFTGAVATWDRLLHVEPSSPYAHRAAREREGVRARREELVGGMAGHAGGA